MSWYFMHAIADERNLVGLCVFHHGQVEQKKLYVAPSDECREFAREYGLESSLESDERKAVYSRGSERRSAA